jgi:hypothetical protein
LVDKLKNREEKGVNIGNHLMENPYLQEDKIDDQTVTLDEILQVLDTENTEENVLDDNMENENNDGSITCLGSHKSYSVSTSQRLSNLREIVVHYELIGYLSQTYGKKQNKKLEKIYLSCQNDKIDFDPAKTKILCKVLYYILKRASHLKNFTMMGYIFLEQFLFFDIIIKAFQKSCFTHTLKSITLSFCQIIDLSFLQFCEVLSEAKFPVLEQCSFNNNKINKSALTFIERVLPNSPITLINFESNIIEKDIIQQIEKINKKCNITIKLGNNHPISERKEKKSRHPKKSSEFDN